MEPILNNKAILSHLGWFWSVRGCGIMLWDNFVYSFYVIVAEFMTLLVAERIINI